MRKEFLELTIKLSSQGLIMDKDPRCPLTGLDDISPRKSLASASSTLQDLPSLIFLNAFH